MQRFDVAVLGGGMVGAATAYHLACAGASTVLVERGQLNRGASGQNAGSLHFQLEHRMIEHGADLAARFALSIPLSLLARRRWPALERELGADLEVTQHGGLMVAETEVGAAVLASKQAIEHAHGLVHTSLLSGDEARERAPYLAPTVTAAGWCPDEGHADPRLVGPAFARAASRCGASIRAQHRVVGLTQRADGWRVRLDGGQPIQATSVAVTAGAWSGEVMAMADVRLPVVPIALSMLVTARAQPCVPHLVQHVDARLSLKQAHAGNVLLGGGWPSTLVQRQGSIALSERPRLCYEALVGNAAVATRVVPELARLPVIRCWSGVTALTPDELPLLGEVPRRPGLFVAAGGSGFTHGPVYADLLSRMILGGEQPIAIDDYSPARFAHLNFA